ncbi:MAG: TIGR02391 family protein [Deltaproteobacteria bacterium RBG_16_49_23]|nr:MAG: TIGR02391 family protein [Deltaproteobacteria bacterium RBG_16_49_23]
MNILDLIDDPQVLIGLAPEELAYQLLQVGQSNLQNGIVHRNVIISTDSPVGQPQRLQRNQQQEVEVALIEALHWLEVNAFLLPAPGINGQNGFRMFGRRGRELLDRNRFDQFRRAASLPKAMLHPSISDRVWIALARGDLSDAVFIAFRAVEEAVRAKGGFAETDIGVDLMRRAFNPDNGPLTNQQQNRPEREALSHLFAGAIGSYKNPHSHRTITISDSSEAQEMVLLASHLLRIVDSR